MLGCPRIVAKSFFAEIVLAAFAAFAQPLFAQKFDVAAVEPATQPVREPMFCIGPCTFGERFSVTGTHLSIRYMSLYNLVLRAFRIKPSQLLGPEWMKSERFDVAATIPAGVQSDQVPAMLQALLAERFRLSIHRENREQPVLALVVSGAGLKLKKSTADSGTASAEPAGSHPLYTPQGDARQLGNGDLVMADGIYGPMRGGRGPNGPMQWHFLKLTMPMLAEMLTPHMDRPVLDMTALEGSYELTFENHPPADMVRGAKSVDATGADGPMPDPFGEGLQLAIARAGLKLEARKIAIETVVIDHLEKIPTAN